MDTFGCVLSAVVFMVGVALIFLGILSLCIKATKRQKWWEGEQKEIEGEQQIKKRDSWKASL